MSGKSILGYSSGDLSQGGEIDGNIIVSGDGTFENLLVNDTITTNTLVTVETVETKDNLLHLSIDNVADTATSGYYHELDDGSKKYSGILRDGTTHKHYVIEKSTVLPLPTTDATLLPRGDMILNDLTAVNVNATNVNTGNVDTTGILKLGENATRVDISSTGGGITVIKGDLCADGHSAFGKNQAPQPFEILNARENVIGSEGNFILSGLQGRPIVDADIAGEYKVRGVIATVVVDDINYNANSFVKGFSSNIFPVPNNIVGSSNLECTISENFLNISDNTTFNAKDIIINNNYVLPGTLEDGILNADNLYFIKVADSEAVNNITNVYGLYIEEQTKGTNKYTIYTTGGNCILQDAVAIGGTTIDDNASLDLSATTDKCLLLPYMNTTTRDGLIGKVVGLLIYNTSLDKVQYWNGSVWENVVENPFDQDLNTTDDVEFNVVDTFRTNATIIDTKIASALSIGAITQNSLNIGRVGAPTSLFGSSIILSNQTTCQSTLNIEGQTTFNTGINTYQMPLTRPLINQVLKAIDGNGNLDWSSIPNPFDQNLNTTDTPTFASLNIIDTAGTFIKVDKQLVSEESKIEFALGGVVKSSIGLLANIGSGVQVKDVSTGNDLINFNNTRTVIQRPELKLQGALLGGSDLNFIIDREVITDSMKLKFAQLGTDRFSLGIDSSANNLILRNEQFPKKIFEVNQNTDLITVNEIYSLPNTTPTNGDIVNVSGGNMTFTSSPTIANLTASTSMTLGVGGTNWTLPVTRGLNNQILKTNATGVVSWQDDEVGTGDVSGGATSVDNEVVIYNGTGGKTIKSSNLTTRDFTGFAKAVRTENFLHIKSTSSPLSFPNNNIETDLMTLGSTIPANFLKVGDKIKWKMTGELKSINNANLTFYISICNSKTTYVQMLDLHTALSQYTLEVELTIRAIGVSGNGIMSSYLSVDRGDPNCDDYRVFQGLINIDTTSTANNVKISGKFDAASTSNELFARQGFISLI